MSEEQKAATPPKNDKIVYMAPDQILIQEGFNGRDFSHPENQQHVLNIKDAIVGAGKVREPILVRQDGKLTYLVNGETRHRAVQMLWEEGRTDIFLPAIILPKGTTEIEMNYISIEVNNSGKKWEPQELSGRVKHLIDLGETTESIARRLGKTRTAVENMLKYIEAPVSVQEVVKEGKIAFTEAVEVLREHGGVEGAKVITEAVQIAQQDAEAKGKAPEEARATRKHTTAAKVALGTQRESTGKLGPVATAPAYKPPYDALKHGIDAALKAYPNSVEMKRFLEAALRPPAK